MTRVLSEKVFTTSDVKFAVADKNGKKDARGV